MSVTLEQSPTADFDTFLAIMRGYPVESGAPEDFAASDIPDITQATNLLSVEDAKARHAYSGGDDAMSLNTAILLERAGVRHEIGRHRAPESEAAKLPERATWLRRGLGRLALIKRAKRGSSLHASAEAPKSYSESISEIVEPVQAPIAEEDMHDLVHEEGLRIWDALHSKGFAAAPLYPGSSHLQVVSTTNQKRNYAHQAKHQLSADSQVRVAELAGRLDNVDTTNAKRYPRHRKITNQEPIVPQFVESEVTKPQTISQPILSAEKVRVHTPARSERRPVGRRKLAAAMVALLAVTNVLSSAGTSAQRVGAEGISVTVVPDQASHTVSKAASSQPLQEHRADTVKADHGVSAAATAVKTHLPTTVVYPAGKGPWTVAEQALKAEGKPTDPASIMKRTAQILELNHIKNPTQVYGEVRVR